jgi:hypothetical protein
MRRITALALLIVVSACGAMNDSPSPTGPNEPVSQPRILAVGPSVTAAGKPPQVSPEPQTFPLLAGSFTITNREGDTIVGTYAGASVFQAGSQTASVTLQIVSGSGEFAGASGSFTLSGVGSFADEGAFRLHGHGEIVLADGKRTNVRLNLRGTSGVTCSASERILISQTATGTLGHAGRVTATLSHEVGNTGCSS